MSSHIYIFRIPKVSEMLAKRDNIGFKPSQLGRCRGVVIEPPLLKPNFDNTSRDGLTLCHSCFQSFVYHLEVTTIEGGRIPKDKRIVIKPHVLEQREVIKGCWKNAIHERSLPRFG